MTVKTVIRVQFIISTVSTCWVKQNVSIFLKVFRVSQHMGSCLSHFIVHSLIIGREHTLHDFSSLNFFWKLSYNTGSGLFWQRFHEHLRRMYILLFWSGVLYKWASLVTQTIMNLPAMQEIWVWSLGWEDPLEKGKATHFSILACRIPWKGEPGRLQCSINVH